MEEGRGTDGYFGPETDQDVSRGQTSWGLHHSPARAGRGVNRHTTSGSCVHCRSLWGASPSLGRWPGHWLHDFPLNCYHSGSSPGGQSTILGRITLNKTRLYISSFYPSSIPWLPPPPTQPGICSPETKMTEIKLETWRCYHSTLRETFLPFLISTLAWPTLCLLLDIT